MLCFHEKVSVSPRLSLIPSFRNSSRGKPLRAPLPGAWRGAPEARHVYSIGSGKRASSVGAAWDPRRHAAPTELTRLAGDDAINMTRPRR